MQFNFKSKNLSKQISIEEIQKVLKISQYVNFQACRPFKKISPIQNKKKNI